MARQEYIGLRVARWRDIAGITQQDLADRVRISREHLSRIENGRVPVTNRALLASLSTALGVSVEDLTGQPPQPRDQHDLNVYRALPALRGALDDTLPDGPLDAADVRVRLDRATRDRMNTNYSVLARSLPQVIVDARRLVELDDPDGLPLFVQAAVVASLALRPFGYVDLAVRFAERAQHAADRYGSPVQQAAAAFASAQCALAAGTRGGQERSLTTAARAAEHLGDGGDDAGLSWWVMLHLHASLSAATLGQVDVMRAHQREAAAAAPRVGSDPWRMEPTPANVAVWRAGAALELEDGQAALAATRSVPTDALGTKGRQSEKLIFSARGSWLEGDTSAAVSHLLTACEIAPSKMKTRPVVKELVAQMVRDARRRGTPELQTLAVRVGVDPLDPDVT